MTFANLQGADLEETDLRGVDFGATELQDVRLWHARLDGTRFDRHKLGDRVHEETTGEYERAADVYFALNKDFQSYGDEDGVRWSYIKQRRMQRMSSAPWRKVRVYSDKRSIPDLVVGFFKWALHGFADLSCLYGESFLRPLGWMLVLWLCCAVCYGLFDAAIYVSSSSPSAPVHSISDLLVFSIGSMTTIGFAKMEPRTNLAAFAVNAQALTSILLTVPLGFAIQNYGRKA